jgi:hypothetical protein
MQNHVIQRLSIDAKAGDSKAAFQSQNQLSYWIHTNNFRRQLEILFDEIVTEDQYLKIDRIDMEFDIYDEHMFPIHFLKELRNAISNKLKDVTLNKIEGVSLFNESKLEENAMIEFLVKGYFQYGIDEKIRGSVHESIKELQFSFNEKLTDTIFKTGSSNPLVWKRILFIVGLNGIAKLLLQQYRISIDFAEWINEFGKELISKNVKSAEGISIAHNELMMLLWQQVLKLLGEERSMEDIRERLLNMAEANFFYERKDVDLLMAKENTENNKKELLVREDGNADDIDGEPGKKALHIHNAGSVLIWVEVGLLIRKLDLVEGKKFKDAVAQQQAILLFYYIINGHVDSKEDELLLYKLLCGWPISAPVDPAASPGKEVQQLADEMLQDFVFKWRNDKNFSSGWLRKNFFRHEGTLLLRDDGNWKLEVEKRTEDILLDAPGSKVSKPTIIKYTWMEKLLFVQW